MGSMAALILSAPFIQTAHAPTLLGGTEAEITAVHTDVPEAVIEARKPVRSPEALIAQYPWDADVAYAVMMAESQGEPRAYNPEWHRGCQGSVGLFQIACLHVDDPDRLFDPAYNVQKAYEIWQREGWQPWGAYTNLSYQRYLVQ